MKITRMLIDYSALCYQVYYGFVAKDKDLTEIPLLNTKKVTNMNRMFKECTSLSTISSIDTSNVTNMDGIFYGCLKLDGKV